MSQSQSPVDGAAFDDVVGESHLQGVICAQTSGGEDELFGFGWTNEARQPLGPSSAWNDAQCAFGESDDSSLGEHPQIAGQGQLAAAAEGDTVDGGDGGHGQSLHEIHDAANPPQKGPHLGGVHGGAFLEIGTRAEGLVPTRKNHRPHLSAHGHGLDLNPQRLQQAPRQGIHGLGPVHAQNHGEGTVSKGDFFDFDEGHDPL